MCDFVNISCRGLLLCLCGCVAPTVKFPSHVLSGKLGHSEPYTDVFIVVVNIRKVKSD